MDAVLNMGMPAPIDVQVAGSSLERSYSTATLLASRIRMPGVAELYIPQDLDYPALQLDVDRIRTAKLGLDQKEVVGNIITALTSNAMIAPTFWIDRSGYDYMLAVQYKEGQIRSMGDLKAIALRGAGQKNPARLDSVSSLRRVDSPTEVDHYQLRRVIDVYVRPLDEDLSRIAKAIDGLIAETKLPAGVTVTMRGMVQGMRVSFQSFTMGLLLAVLLLYLILVAQFRSFMDRLIIPDRRTAGSGRCTDYAGSHRNNAERDVADGCGDAGGHCRRNSILIVEFTRHLREEGMVVHRAVALACRVRLRPVLMTSLGNDLRIAAHGIEVRRRQRGIRTAGASDSGRTGRLRLR